MKTKGVEAYSLSRVLIFIFGGSALLFLARSLFPVWANSTFFYFGFGAVISASSPFFLKRTDREGPESTMSNQSKNPTP
jgi:hypothetical protein